MELYRARGEDVSCLMILRPYNKQTLNLKNICFLSYQIHLILSNLRDKRVLDLEIHIENIIKEEKLSDLVLRPLYPPHQHDN